MDANSITAYATVALAVITGLLAIYTYKLWSATKSMALDTLRTTENQLRAYLHLEVFSYFSHVLTQTGEIYWSVHPVWRNGGTTPALNVYLYTSFYLSDKEMSDEYSFNLPETLNTESVIGPNSTTQSKQIIITAANLEKIKKRELFFYIWGIAKYNDIFENTPKRLTQFCHTIGQVLGDPHKEFDSETNVVQIEFSFHHRHNMMGNMPSSNFGAAHKTS